MVRRCDSQASSFSCTSSVTALGNAPAVSVHALPAQAASSKVPDASCLLRYCAAYSYSFSQCPIAVQSMLDQKPLVLWSLDQAANRACETASHKT